MTSPPQRRSVIQVGIGVGVLGLVLLGVVVWIVFGVHNGSNGKPGLRGKPGPAVVLSPSVVPLLLFPAQTEPPQVFTSPGPAKPGIVSSSPGQPNSPKPSPTSKTSPSPSPKPCLVFNPLTGKCVIHIGAP